MEQIGHVPHLLLTNAPWAVIANPDMTEPNTSSNVLEFTASLPGDPWAGYVFR